MNSARKVVITGGVAVGKSSVLAAVREELTNMKMNHVYVPEYIDVKADGVAMLNKYFDKSITVYEFQTYILNYYREYLATLKVGKDDIVLFERVPDDGITCYSNLDNSIGRLSDDEFLSLYRNVKDLDTHYNIPSYLLGNNFVFFPIKSVDAKQDGRLIAEIIRNRSDANLIFGLYNTDEICYQRMLKRNRKGEEGAYSKQSIADFNYHYKQLYKELMYGEGIRFVNLGKLIRV